MQLIQKACIIIYLNMLSHIEKKQRIQKQSIRNEENSILGGFNYNRPSISPLRDQFFTSKVLNKKVKTG